MVTQLLTTDDLQTGEQIEVAVVPSGGAVGKLRVVASPGSGGGVTTVTGTSPIVITGSASAPNVTLNPAATDFWTFDAPISAAAVNPELAQAQATTSTTQNIIVRSQAAEAGSGAAGGGIWLIVGKKDTTAPTSIILGQETAIGGVPPTTNFFGAVDVNINQTSGVVICTLGRGTNGTGGGVAGVEISAFSSLNIATEGTNSPIAIQPASSFGGQAFINHAQNSSTGMPNLQLGIAPGDPFVGSGVFQLGQAVTGVTMNQATALATAAPVPMIFSPQAPNAGASTALEGTPGNYEILLPAPTSTGVDAFVVIGRTGLTQTIAMNNLGGTTINGIFMAPNPSWATGNYCLTQNNTAETLDLNAPAGGTLYFDVGGTGSRLALLDSNGFQFFPAGGAANFGGGTFVIGVNNATTVPTTNPVGGGILYSDAGAGKWRGSGGTVTTFGPAEPHCPVCGSDFVTEHESPIYGYLSVCLKCMADELGERPWIRRTKPAPRV